MAVTISNVSARSIWRQSGQITFNSWKTGAKHNVGYYNSSTSYAIELRFRLDKPCSAITVRTMAESGSGYIYWKVSDKEEDTDLVTRIFTKGNEPDATRAGSWETFTIEGNFPADTDLYIYGSNYGTSYNVIELYGVYDSTHYTKVIAATEIQRWDVTYVYGDKTIKDEKTYGEALTLRDVSFYRNGYTQIGWSTVEGGEISHSLGESYTADEELTLYPVWGIAPKIVLWLLLKRWGARYGN